ncbi:MAG TPA: XdhC family protein, partial [Candidatus Elarobacter sp.]
MIFDRFSAALHADRPVALITRLDGAHAGAKLLVFDDDEEPIGDLGTSGLNHAAAGEARALLAAGETATRTFGQDGEPIGVEVRLFVDVHAPKPKMYVFGAIDFSRAVARLGKYLGY